MRLATGITTDEATLGVRIRGSARSLKGNKVAKGMPRVPLLADI